MIFQFKRFPFCIMDIRFEIIYIGKGYSFVLQAPFTAIRVMNISEPLRYTDALERNYQTRFVKHFTYGCVRVRFPLQNATAR